MVKATAAFSVTAGDGRTVTFVPGDEVPHELAAQVGAHVLDSKPEAEDANPLAGLNFENADEALTAALEKAAEKIEGLEEQVEQLQGELDVVNAWKQKILDGDLSELDLDTLTKPDEDGTAGEDGGAPTDPAVPLFDPSEHKVDQVLAYLEGASPEEDARVRAAEKAGKNRPTILGNDD